jgi:TonB family protein
MIPPESVVATSPQAAEAARKRNADSARMAERLLRRADELDPDNQRWKAALERLHQARMGGGAVTVTEMPAAEPGQKRVTVGGNVQASMLIKKVDPEYPALARQARIQGTVRFTVLLDKEGKVKNMTLLSGHPLMVEPAKNALRQYEYKPTLLNGEPVEVVSQVDVKFTLEPPMGEVR